MNLRIAFYAWNPFQVYQALQVAHHFADAQFIIERRHNAQFDRIFTPSFFRSIDVPFRIVHRSELRALNDNFDVVVHQTPFPFIEEIERPKLVGLQYSMTKESHQYGAWRALSDLTLVYGRYSLDRIAPFCPASMVGNPRLDPWFHGELAQEKLDEIRARLDPRKKTVVYLPTWGELSSIEAYGARVAALQDEFNVIAKVHHNTDALETHKKGLLGEKGIRTLLGACDDLVYLLACADVILSDFSGAIFDAINVGKPVVLLGPRIGHEYHAFGGQSIECRWHERIGPVVDDPAKLADVVRHTLEHLSDWQARHAALREECFEQQGRSGQAAAYAIQRYVADPGERPHYQLYLRQTLRDYRRRTRAGVVFDSARRLVSSVRAAIR